MLSATYKSRYSKLAEELGNDYMKGSNHYPKTVTEAYNLIVKYQWSRPGGRVYNDMEGVAFTNVESMRTSRPQVIPTDIVAVKCYNCNKKGHYSNECPDKCPDKEPTKETEKVKGTTDGITATMTVDEDKATTCDNWEEFNFHQSNRKVNPAWILLYNCSTTDIFCNKKMLTDIRPCSTTLKIHCNAGTKEVNQVGTLKNYGTVWYGMVQLQRDS
jgi:hypothetical protein